MNTNTSKPATVVTLSQETHAKLVEVFRVMHAIVASAPGLESLPSFSECGTPEYNKVMDRAHKAIVSYRKNAVESQYSDVRSKIEHAIASAKERGVKALAAYNNLPLEVRALLNAAPKSSVHVAVKDLLKCFPQGTNAEQATAILHKLGYSLAKGNHKDGSRLSVPLTDKVEAVQEAAE